MLICYVDEAGCTGALPDPLSPIQPVFCIGGLAIEQAQLRSLTIAFLQLKKHLFPNALPAGSGLLDWMALEVKGSDLRATVRTGNRDRRRHAIRVIDKCLELIEACGAKFWGRVWIKKPGDTFNGTSVYTYSVQDICQTFQTHLQAKNDTGILIADSRNKSKNTGVAHSVFTEKFRIAGDKYPRILEMPVFGHSDNHTGLQLCDLICSALIFPLATFAYCTNHVTSVHVSPAYIALRERFGVRLSALQYRYTVDNRWRGGIVTSDAISHKSGGLLFG